MNIASKTLSGVVPIDVATASPTNILHLGYYGQFTLDMPQEVLEICKSLNVVVDTPVWEKVLRSSKEESVSDLFSTFDSPLYAIMRLRNGDDLGKDMFYRISVLSEVYSEEMERSFILAPDPHVLQVTKKYIVVRFLRDPLKSLFKWESPDGPLGFVESFLDSALGFKEIPYISNLIPTLMIHLLVQEIDQGDPTRSKKAACLISKATKLIEYADLPRKICVNHEHLKAAKDFHEADTALASIPEDLLCVEHVHDVLGGSFQLGIYAQWTGTALADFVTERLGEIVTSQDRSVSIKKLISPLYPDEVLAKSNRFVKTLKGRYSTDEEWWARYPEPKRALVEQLAPEYWEKPVRMLLKAVDEKLKEKEIG